MLLAAALGTALNFETARDFTAGAAGRAFPVPGRLSVRLPGREAGREAGRAADELFAPLPFPAGRAVQLECVGLDPLARWFPLAA